MRNLFNYKENTAEMNEKALNIILKLRLDEVRAANDLLAEKMLLTIKKEFTRAQERSKSPQSYMKTIKKLAIRTWLVTVNGEPSSYLTGGGSTPKVTPRFKFNIISMVPNTIQLPKEINLAFVHQIKQIDEMQYRLLYHCKRKKHWYLRIESFNEKKDTHVFSEIRLWESQKIEIHPQQVWERSGYQKAIEEQIVQPEIKDIPVEWMDFGRQEALNFLKRFKKNKDLVKI